MEAYKNWVRQNKDYVHSLDSLANVSLFPISSSFNPLSFVYIVLNLWIIQFNLEIL